MFYMSDHSANDFSSKWVRKMFFEFFQQRGHHLASPIPIVVKDDPSLMFTNAGMNAFKDIFLGIQSPNFTRIANTQPCLRVSGKHNDLEEVGVDNYHHTFFEMLGNWSFGDYFKEQAIQWAWELITEVYGLDKDRLYVSVFAGNPQDALPKDNESSKIWENFLPSERILSFGAKDNFWEMGDTGPCGPCTEIHFDGRTDAERNKIPGHLLVNQDHSEVIEIWNLVFMEFMRSRDGSLNHLKQKHVDTGMGLERLVRILQNKNSNYDTDLFVPIISRISELTNIAYTNTISYQDIAFRVLADHVRAVAFCLSEGARPTNTGAGYVIKRILRRAIRYYYTHLNQYQPLLFQLVPVVVTQFQEVFPTINTQSENIANLIYEEEEQFLRTIGQGMKRLRQYLDMHPREINLPGKVAFELYDTYGFPLDVTQVVLSEEDRKVDEEGFYQAMQEQKTRSRNVANAENIGEWVEINSGNSEFVGFNQFETETKILRYRKVSQAEDIIYQLVLSHSPFYAQGGGQAGDIGLLQAADGRQIKIIDTQKVLGQIVHITKIIPKNLTGIFMAHIDIAKRKAHSIHHSATHLLHAALQQALNAQALQRGSAITDQYLRFDFSCNNKISTHTLQKISDQINDWIKAKLPVKIFHSQLAEAKKMGAMAIFGEKYAEEVRVVKIGEISIELCGGTHVQNTADLQEFRIVQESAISSGIRRIEAIAGQALQNFRKIEADKEQKQLAQLELKINQQLLDGKEILSQIQLLSNDGNNDLLNSWNSLSEQLQNSTNIVNKKSINSQLKQQIELQEKTLAQIYAQNILLYLQNNLKLSQPNPFDLKYCKIYPNLLQVYIPNYTRNMHNLFKNMLNHWRKNGIKLMIFLLAESAAQKSAILFDLGEHSGNALDFLQQHISFLIGGGAGGGEKRASAGGRKIASHDLPKIFDKLAEWTNN